MPVVGTPISGNNTGPSYLTLAAAATLLARLPSTLLAGYRAAGDADKLAALVLASAEIDAADRWQGRKYEATQLLEFPRVATSRAMPLLGIMTPTAYLSPDEIWDWDSDEQAAVVPPAVEMATLHQANAVLDTVRAARLDAQQQGLASQSVGGLSESYAAVVGMDRDRELCRAAARLMDKYRLRSGSML